TLAQTLLGERNETPKLAERVWMTSQGHPFMAVEMLRAFEDEPSLVLAQRRLPERVVALIEAPVARVSSTARPLGDVAAIFGRSFDLPVLQSVAAISDREITESLEEMVRRGIVRSAGEELDFAHDRIREVLYDNVLPVVRKRLHANVADSIERIHARE